MKSHPLHTELLKLIVQHSGKPTQHTFLDSYLGNAHPRYPISIPILRKIAREWMRTHHDVTSAKFVKLLSSLIHAPSSTEKTMAGILMDLSSPSQQGFDPLIFDDWLEHLEGWAEVDAVCTGAYARTQLTVNFVVWKKLLVKFSKSKNIQKRRASLVLLCSPLRQTRNLPMVMLALQNVDRLTSEKEILITKAISWVLRYAVKHHKSEIKKYVALKQHVLPKIAVRETLTVINTGKKTKTTT